VPQAVTDRRAAIISVAFVCRRICTSHFSHANLSFSQGWFPAGFKTAQVLPLLKKPSLDKEQISSYRPISNLTTVSKVIERLVLNS